MLQDEPHARPRRARGRRRGRRLRRRDARDRCSTHALARRPQEASGPRARRRHPAAVRAARRHPAGRLRPLRRRAQRRRASRRRSAARTAGRVRLRRDVAPAHQGGAQDRDAGRAPQAHRVAARRSSTRRRSSRRAPGAGRPRRTPSPIDSCAAAVAAYRERFPKIVELARAIAMAELEIKRRVPGRRARRLLRRLRHATASPRRSSRCSPTTWSASNAADARRRRERDAAGAALRRAADQGAGADRRHPRGDRRSPTGTSTFGSQEPAARQHGDGARPTSSCCRRRPRNLVQLRERIERGLAFAGPALFSVFSGATGNAGDLPPYLVAAAAMESRAFPAFTFDPSAGTDWASRFSLSSNPQVESDWPVHDFAYETQEHQRAARGSRRSRWSHFVACDRRYARHFARVPRRRLERHDGSGRRKPRPRAEGACRTPFRRC